MAQSSGMQWTPRKGCEEAMAMICRVVPPWHAVSRDNGAFCKASDVSVCVDVRQKQ